MERQGLAPSERRGDLTFALPWQRNSEPVGSAAADLLRWLGAEIGRRITPRVALSYDELLPLFEKGEVHFAWLPPISFLRLRAARLVRTLYVNERNAALAFHAIIAVRSGSRHYSLDRLRGARAAWVDPMSTTGYVLPRLDLAARGIDPRTTFSEDRFLGSHDAAARAVLEGRSDVFGTFAEYDGQRIARAGFTGMGSSSDWRVVLRGRESPSDVLAAHVSVDDALAGAMKQALSRALASPETAKLVGDALHVEAFGDADDARYASLADAVDAAHREGLLPHL